MIKLGCVLCFFQLMMFVSTALGRLFMRPSYNAGTIVDKRTGRVIGPASREEVRRHIREDIKEIKAIPLKETYWSGAFIVQIFLVPILGIWFDPISQIGIPSNMYTGVYGWDFNVLYTLVYGRGFPMGRPSTLPLLVKVLILLGIMAFATYMHLKVGAAVKAGKNRGYCKFVFIIKIIEAVMSIAIIATTKQIADGLILVMPFVVFVEIALTVITLILLRGISANDI